MLTVYATIAVRQRGERPAHHLPEPDERQRDEDEEHAGDGFERHDESREVAGAVLRAEVDLLRRSLSAHVDHHGAVLGEDVEHDAGERHADKQGRHDRFDQVAPIRGRQTADRDPEKCREQRDVGEEGEIHHHAAEPADARQLQEQDEKADEKQVGGATRLVGDHQCPPTIALPRSAPSAVWPVV